MVFIGFFIPPFVLKFNIKNEVSLGCSMFTVLTCHVLSSFLILCYVVIIV